LHSALRTLRLLTDGIDLTHNGAIFILSDPLDEYRDGSGY
jgi:hypothetical protein